MNKAEFFQILESKLGNAPKDLRDDVMTDFNEHFELGRISGESEADICSKLGDPNEIAQQYLEEFREILSKVKEQDAFPNKPICEEEPNRIKRLVVKLLSKDMEVTDRGGYLRIDAESGKRISFRYEASDQSLIVEEQRIKINFRELSNESFSVYKDFDLKNIPAAHLERISLFSVSGDINLRLEDTNAEIEAHSSSGDLSLKLNNVGGGLKAHTASGDVKLQSKNLAGMLSLRSASGDVEVETEHILGEIELHSASGDVNLKCEKIVRPLRAESASGDVNLRIRNVAADISVKTVSGDINTKLGRGSSVRLSISSVSGDVKQSFPGVDRTQDENIYEIYLKTLSGDIGISDL